MTLLKTLSILRAALKIRRLNLRNPAAIMTQRRTPSNIQHPTSNICLPCLFLLAAPLLAQQTAPQTVKGLTTAPGLEAKLWASEPDLINPTNIDIDSRGRIWVLEAVNYRR